MSEEKLRKNVDIYKTIFNLSLLFLRKLTEPFCFGNATNLTHDFLYDKFNKKILVNLLVKISQIAFNLT